LVQFGISYTQDSDLKAFADSTIMDDPQLDPPIPFDEGVISFAGSGPNSRTSHLFIAYGPVPSLGKELWETPIGTVIDGMENVRRLNSEYGDMPPWGHGPQQHKIRQGGLAYIEQEFPNLDKFISCQVELVGVEEGNDDREQQPQVVEEKVAPVVVSKNKVEQPAEKREDHNYHIGFPVTAAVVVFLILTYLTKRGKRKILNKNN